MDFFRGLFGGGSRDDGVYLYVKCNKCAEITRVRISRSSEMRQLFEESDGRSGYAVRKVVVDSKCFRPIEVNLIYDSGRREVSRDVDGGQIVDRSLWEAQRAARQAPS
jgi:hypothetical protein